MRILLLTRYDCLGSSSRLRFLQYLPFLKAEGIDVTVAPLLDNKYVKDMYTGKSKSVKDIFSAYLHRLVLIFKASKFDLLYIEKELFPWLPAFGENILTRLRIPYAVDYDDAIFHSYNRHSSSLVRTVLGKKIDTVMRHAALVTVGNEYLEEDARQAGARQVEVLPTVIDLDRYSFSPQTGKDYFSIGWIGSPVTSHYLHLVQPALQELCNDGSSRLVLVGSGEIGLNGVPLEIRSWSEETENKDIQDFDVGIMPLPNNPWERGKCGYKLIQYMASCRPVIASPVGVNQQIIDNGVNGFLASTQSEWIHALETLRANKSLRESMGKAGRKNVEARYCLQVTAPRLVSLLRSVVKGGN